MKNFYKRTTIFSLALPIYTAKNFLRTCLLANNFANNLVIFFTSTPINKKIFLFIENNSKTKEIVTMPTKKDMYIFYSWLLYLLIVPIFFTNMLIFFHTIDIYSISPYNIFSLIFISFSLIYGLSIASLNLLLGNKYNG